MLYPTELLGHISKLFNFSAQTDSNELPLRRFFQAEAHGRLLCHAMAKTAIKSGGFRRLYYARHFPLKYRLQRMELPKKIAPISESYF